MSKRATGKEGESRGSKAEAEAVERELQRAFTPEVIDELRAKTGYVNADTFALKGAR